MDIKKLGWIPYGGGHRGHGPGRREAEKTKTAANRHPGYAQLHNAVHDHSHHRQFIVPAFRWAA